MPDDRFTGPIVPLPPAKRSLQTCDGGRKSKRIVSVYHGFDHESFFHDQTPLPATVVQQLLPSDRTIRLLFVSHYNYYRNFETLFRAVAILKRQLKDIQVKLVLTCKLNPGENPGRITRKGG